MRTWAAAPVMGLVMERMLNSVSRSIGNLGLAIAPAEGLVQHGVAVLDDQQLGPDRHLPVDVVLDGIRQCLQGLRRHALALGRASGKLPRPGPGG